jgi:hypothetical protein
MSAPIGRRTWAIAGGFAPSSGTGPEPEFTAHDRLALLNAGDALANVRITVLYARHGEVGPFRLGVAPRRVRQVRVNDLIFPEAVRLDEAYGLVVRSDVPVVVQFTRQDTRGAAAAGFLANAWFARSDSKGEGRGA